MDELLKEIAAEKEHIANTLAALENTLAREERSFVELAAIATCLHNAYNGIENLLKRILQYLKIAPPDSKSSHKDLLIIAEEHKIITRELSESLDEYRAFRHFFVHGYGILLSEAPLQPLAENLPEIWRRFETELDNFVEALQKQK